MLLWTTPIFLLLLANFSYCQNQSINCKSKETCSACIQQLDCVWCVSPLVAGSRQNCLHKNDASLDWCKTEDIQNPQIVSSTIKNESLISTDKNVVQLTPQKMTVRLRKGETFQFNFQYKQAQNYPVDLYYIMDMSSSMKDYKNALASQAQEIASAMLNLTRNFRLGFGSFVDKTDMPFTSTSDYRRDNPCGNEKCAPAYSFKNHMSLEANHTKFSDEVARAPISANIDPPEGTLDALMQAIVCKDVINWRTDARRFIVISTDADYHIAGDGKLAGVIEPHDGKCHMINNEYSHGLILDYPSISHINYVAKENNVNIIFAIASGKKPYILKIYEDLAKSIENSNYGKLDKNSANIVKLIKQTYDKTVNSVVMSENSSSAVGVNIVANNCPKGLKNGCSNVILHQLLDFTGTLTAMECIDGPQTIAIKPTGVNEALNIEVEVVCACDCEQKTEANSPMCNGTGTLKCGVCDCNSNYFGHTCECNEMSTSSKVDNCRAKPEDPPCSGLGTCKCGVCTCNRRPTITEEYTGMFCECNNFSCKRHQHRVCNNQGVCQCDQTCRCNSDWVGDACECPHPDISCIKMGDGAYCSDKGHCECGVCVCHNPALHSGKYCHEKPSDDPTHKCPDHLQECINCQSDVTKCPTNCSITECFIGDPKAISPTDEDLNLKNCDIIANDGSTYYFQYDDSDKPNITVVSTKRICPQPAPILPWLLGVVGSILLGGIIILIIWKVCTTIHDRREYEKFHQEIDKTKWPTTGNPIFVDAVTSFQNPTFEQSS